MKVLALILCLLAACFAPDTTATAEQDSTRVCGSPPVTCWPTSNVDQCAFGCRLAGFDSGWCPGYTFEQYWYCFQLTNVFGRNCKTADGNEHRECLFIGGNEQCEPNWPILCNPGSEPLTDESESVVPAIRTGDAIPPELQQTAENPDDYRCMLTACTPGSLAGGDQLCSDRCSGHCSYPDNWYGICFTWVHTSPRLCPDAGGQNMEGWCERHCSELGLPKGSVSCTSGLPN